MMRTLACHTTYRTATPAFLRIARRLAAHAIARDLGFLALVAAGFWATDRLLWIIATSVKLLVC